MHVFFLLNQSNSAAFLIKAAAEARSDTCQNQLESMEAQTFQQNEFAEGQARLAELAAGEAAFIEEIQVSMQINAFAISAYALLDYLHWLVHAFHAVKAAVGLIYRQKKS